MSTDIYLRCVTHDPYLQSDEVGHNTSALVEIRKAILDSDRIRESMQELIRLDDYPQLEGYKRTLWWFLYKHPMCDLEIWDECGQQYSLEDTVGEKPIGRDTILGKVESITDVPGGVSVFFGSLTLEGERVLRRIQSS